MIRVGLLGASRIADAAVIKPARHYPGVQVRTLAARDPSRAQRYAAAHEIPETCCDYAGLVASTDIDLVYNALPPSEHKDWTIAALRAGKHVLCEKPFALSADEAEAMVGAARDTGNVLIEAFHYCFHPLFLRVLELTGSGAIGTVRRVDAHFNTEIAFAPTELRFVRALGGGALMDLGCYPLHWVRHVVGEEPDVASAVGEWHEAGVDVAMSADLAFPGGARARVQCSMAGASPGPLDNRLQVTGDLGTLTVNNLIAPHLGHELRLETDEGVVTETLSTRPTYHYQLQHVIGVIEGSAPQVTGGDDAINTMRLINAVYRKALGQDAS
ncbi:MAG: Gfo/Idh/MocA family oxidoreductase [Pseudomonadota bacterium]